MAQTIIIRKSFDWAHGGCEVRSYRASAEPVEVTDDDLVRVAVHEGWAELVKPGAPEPRAQAAAPENRDAAPRRRTRQAPAG